MLKNLRKMYNVKTMIEELEEYLIRKGWSEDIAYDISESYRLNGVSGVNQVACKMSDMEHDYVDEIVSMINEWGKEVGENGFWICKEKLYAIYYK